MNFKILSSSALNDYMGLIISMMMIASVSVQAYTDNGIFRQNFDDPSVDDWDFNSLIRVQDYSNGGVDYGRILKVAYPPDDRGSPRVTNKFNLDNQVKSATLSFDVKFHSKFEFVKGGKMHGLGGGSTTSGCDPVDPDGWSVRLTWKEEGVPQVYVYHQDRVARCGDGFRPDNFKFERGQWYRIDLQVQMNSAPDSSDGRTLLFIDGEKLVEVNGMRLSGNENVDIEKFMFSTFYGGSSSSWSPSKTTYVYYDNFTVSQGLMVTGVQGTECEISLGGIYNSDKEVCCANSCGSCGGSGCGGLPGGGSQCCTGSISRSDKTCEASSSAPCIFG